MLTYLTTMKFLIFAQIDQGYDLVWDRVSSGRIPQLGHTGYCVGQFNHHGRMTTLKTTTGRRLRAFEKSL
jgi:hypothetical protein